MSDLIGHLLSFRKAIAVIAGLGLLLLALLSTLALNETGTLVVYLLVAGVVILGSVLAIYLRIVAKESAQLQNPPPDWERDRGE
ncbi:hypothetical protein [Haloarchaeobius amylolyticus]|uniref:hypothetical protein n=1 Tax=Haloarchaeobius amylolyticus TaxID=1198296 RepID=UPI00226E75CB|nr:hypothetical protein [Haloarchaeobius amylolyticus]